MGKGDGEHPPEKFISDQCFCQLSIFVFMGASITLSSLSAGMDNGGSFPFPYFIFGFGLGIILIVNLIARRYVVRTVQEKGVTRKNILDTLNNTTWGTHIWPWTCRVGMLWCIAGSITTGLGGVNCNIEENNDTNAVTNETSNVKNTCYYDIEGENAELYKGLAIGLVVMHVASFAYLLLSHCPTDSVIDQIKEDPRRNVVKPATSPPAAASAVAASTNTAQASNTPRADAELEMKTKLQRLEARVKELEELEKETQRRQLSVLPPPPAYNELMNVPGENSSGAFPGTSFPLSPVETFTK